MCCCPNLEVELTEEDPDPGTFAGLQPTRRCTDIFALLLTIAFYIAVAGLTAYCIYNSDTAKLFNGYDDCGNICGRNNLADPTIPYECYGKDMVTKKYVMIWKDPIFGTRRRCVKKCGKSIVTHYCVRTRYHVPIYNEVQDFYGCILLISFTVVIGLLTCWASYSNYKDLKFTRGAYFVPCFALAVLCYYSIRKKVKLNIRRYVVERVKFTLIVTSCFLAISIIPSYYLYSMKLQLTVELHREAMAAIKTFPAFWKILLACFLLLTAITVALGFSFIPLKSFSYLDLGDNVSYDPVMTDYIEYPISIATQYILIGAFLLLCALVMNFQIFVVSGCVAQWYFHTTQGNLIRRTIYYLFRYHLGTLCAHSIILTMTFPLRVFVNVINDLCLNCLTCTGLLSRDGLTMTAIYGHGFCLGTGRANKLLEVNSYNVEHIKEISKKYFVCWKIITWFALLGTFYAILYYRHRNVGEIMPISLFWFFWSYFIVECFTTGMETAIDTIFLCFCEDCLFNDGKEKPYFMSQDLARSVASANELIFPEEWNEVVENWRQGPGLLL